MLKGQVFSNQLFESHMFALFINTFVNGTNGIPEHYKNGMEVTYSGSNISIGTGAILIQGRLLEEDTGTILNAGTDPLYCKLIIEIDLDKVNTQSDFEQAYYSIITDINNYPTLHGSDIVNNVSGKYQYELAQFRTTASGITDFIDRRTFLDIEALYQTLRNQYATELLTIESHLRWKKIAELGLNDSEVVTINNLSSYNEIMITVGNSSENPERILASTTIPVGVLLSSTNDSSNGFYQVAYTPANSDYIILAGVSYLGNNQLKLYTNARATLAVYAK